jgi:hypothetical protein
MIMIPISYTTATFFLTDHANKSSPYLMQCWSVIRQSICGIWHLIYHLPTPYFISIRRPGRPGLKLNAYSRGFALPIERTRSSSSSSVLLQ